MQKKTFENKLVIFSCFMLLSITLGGCKAENGYTETMEQENDTTSEIMEQENDTTSETIEEQVATMEQDKPIEQTDYDYDSFLGKVWVYDSWGGDTCDYGIFFSFRILELGETMKAEYSIGGVECPAYYSSSLPPYMMYGPREDDVWHCNFENVLYSGEIWMAIKNEDCIEMEIQYEKIPSWDEETSDGICQFRPYNITDVNNLEKNENLVKTISTIYGENLYLVPVQISTEKNTKPDAFIVDGNGNIYFRFSYQPSGSIIDDVIVEDINQDGLEDVNLVMKENVTVDEKLIAKVFLQSKNGTFIKYPVAYCAYSEGKTYDMDEDLSYCGTLVTQLATALENGTIETFLTQESYEPQLLEESDFYYYIAEEMDEHRLREFYQSFLYKGENIEEKNVYLVKQDDMHFDIVIQEKRGGEYFYYTFTCESLSKDEEVGAFLTEVGMETMADTAEHYFLACNGEKYLCIPKRDETGNIIEIVLHTFENKILSDEGNMYEDEYDYYGSAIALTKTDKVTITRYDYVDGGNR